MDFLNLDFLESSWISWDHDFGNARQCLMREVLLVAQYEHSSYMRVYASGKRSGEQIERFCCPPCVPVSMLDFLFWISWLDFLWICKPYIGPGFLVLWISSGFLVDFLKPYIGVFFLDFLWISKNSRDLHDKTSTPAPTRERLSLLLKPLWFHDSR